MFDLKSFDTDNGKSERDAGGETDFRVFVFVRGAAYKFAISFKSLEAACRHGCVSSPAQPSRLSAGCCSASAALESSTSPPLF